MRMKEPAIAFVLSRDEIEATVRRLLQKYHAQSAILFGSYARDEADCASDIDVIIIGGEQFELTDIFSIAEELYQETGKEVDVYEICEIDQDSDFYRTILQEGVKIAA